MTPLLEGARLRVLLATTAQKRPTVRSVAAATVAHSHLRGLRADGWVTWTEGSNGTLRSTLAVVAHFPLNAGASSCPSAHRETDAGATHRGFETARGSGVGPGALCHDCDELGVDPDCYCQKEGTR